MGEPFPWSAPTLGGINPKTGKRTCYQSTKLKKWQSEIRSQVVHLERMIDGPLILRIQVYATQPPSNKDFYPITKPDLDNQVKSFLDAIRDQKGIKGIIKDDNRIIDTVSKKRWAHQRPTYQGFPGIDFSLEIVREEDENETFGK